MGNYSGTIRCGHCYEQGHNRAGCEKLTEQYKNEWEYVKDNVDPTAYRYSRVRDQLAKRTGTDPLTGESKRRREATYGGRKCSYCTDKGHNRRTCPAFKADKAKFSAMTVQTRAAALASMREHGFGPGALIVADDYGQKVPCLVTGIEWESMNRKDQWPAAVHARRVTDNRPCVLSFPREVTGSTSTWNQTEIVGRAPAVEPPAGWADGSRLDLQTVGLFGPGAARDYFFWRDCDDDNA